VTKGVPFDPYALLEALERMKVSYVVVGAFARVVQGSGELTHGIDIAPSLREENLRRLAQALGELGGTEDNLVRLAPEALTDEPVGVATRAGTLTVVPKPWGTRGYDDLRIRASRENLGRTVRPRIASTVDLVRMLEATSRTEDSERLHRLRRMMELERRRTHRRSLHLER
jgi:hypothetical protein